MFPAALQNWARQRAQGLVSPLVKMGISPNAVTVVGFVLNLVTAAVLVAGSLRIGGVLLFLSALFDMLDGAVARAASRQSRFGAFLDSLLDRYSEAAILGALLYVFAVRHNVVAVSIVYVAAIGSLLISYARARAEGVGLDAKVGVAPRPERIVILGVGLLISENATVGALIILAILTHVTAIQRLYHVWRQTTRLDAPPPQPSSGRKAVAARDGVE
jgi:CDP-diacylglycerol--glycerol-3-phosphate 3-phosphatidyltransferase